MYARAARFKSTRIPKRTQKKTFACRGELRGSTPGEDPSVAADLRHCRRAARFDGVRTPVVPFSPSCRCWRLRPPSRSRRMSAARLRASLSSPMHDSTLVCAQRIARAGCERKQLEIRPPAALRRVAATGTTPGVVPRFADSGTTHSLTKSPTIRRRGRRARRAWSARLPSSALSTRVHSSSCRWSRCNRCGATIRAAASL